MAEIVERIAEDVDEAAAAAHRAVVAPEIARRRSRSFLVIALAAFAGYLALLLFVRSHRQFHADLAATIRLQAQDHPLVARLMSVVSWFGFRPQSLLLPGSTVAGLWLLRFRLESVFLVAAWMSSLMSFMTKLVVRRPRPSGARIRVAEANIRDTSFPSGHTLHYVSFWGFVTYLSFTRIRNRVARGAVVGVLVSMIGLVGPSRIYLGHHWLTDVLASYLLGIAYLIGLVSLYRWVRSLLGNG